MASLPTAEFTSDDLVKALNLLGADTKGTCVGRTQKNKCCTYAVTMVNWRIGVEMIESLNGTMWEKASLTHEIEIAAEHLLCRYRDHGDQAQEIARQWAREEPIQRNLIKQHTSPIHGGRNSSPPSTVPQYTTTLPAKTPNVSTTSFEAAPVLNEKLQQSTNNSAADQNTFIETATTPNTQTPSLYLPHGLAIPREGTLEEMPDHSGATSMHAQALPCEADMTREMGVSRWVVCATLRALLVILCVVAIVYFLIFVL